MRETSIHYGTVEIMPSHKIIDGHMHLGGYSIYRDRAGNEVKRTEPTYHTRLAWE